MLVIVTAVLALHGIYRLRGGASSACPFTHPRSAAPSALASNAFPRATTFIALNAHTGVFAAYIGPDLLGHIVDTAPFALDAQGFAGPTPLVLAIDAEGSVHSVTLHPNRETTRYVERIYASPWWGSLTGRACIAVAESLHDVDAVSGATFTSAALQQHLRAAFAHLDACKRRADSAAPAQMPRGRAGRFEWVPLAAILALVTILSLRPAWHTRWVRWALWIVVVAVLGVWRPYYFSVVHIAALIQGRLPGPDAIGWYLVVGFALLSPIFIGRAYCRHVCPFGVLSELLARWVPWHVRLPRWCVRIAPFTRGAVLLAVVALVVLLPVVPVDCLEPFNAVFVRPALSVYTIFGFGALICSALCTRLWCVCFCPDGALFELIARLGRKRRGACARCPASAPPTSTP